MGEGVKGIFPASCASILMITAWAGNKTWRLNFLDRGKNNTKLNSQKLQLGRF